MNPRDCPHEVVEIRKKRGWDFKLYWQGQCSRCKKAMGVKSTEGEHKAPWWAYPRRPNSKRRAYEKHLKSRQFASLRQKVLERDNFECRHCGEPATTADHLTYERFGAEEIGDLVAACKDCNTARRMVATKPRRAR